jgi:NAD(P)H-flavin reductase
MIDAAKDDAAEPPAWWIATVTGIERRGPDIAVLTLQPEQPLAYLPGQHISVQTLAERGAPAASSATTWTPRLPKAGKSVRY